MDVDTARSALLSRRVLEERGLSSRQMAKAVEGGELVRVHHGVYVDGSVWRAAQAEARHLLRVVAVDRGRRGGDPINAFVSAAVLWQLPLYRLDPERVHLAGRSADGHVSSARSGVARHNADIEESDRAVVQGVTCTGLARTVADMIRLAPEEAGVSVADAALRRVAFDERTREYDEDAAAAFSDAVTERLERIRGARGVRRGRRILAMADGRAQLPGESVSRLQLIRLGFAAPRLQVAIAAPFGGYYYVDFGLDDVRAWGEFDGEVKYRDPAMRPEGHDPLDVMVAEKMREDWIRGTTNRRMPRWGSMHIVTAERLGERLAAFHVRPPG
ncbi:hypothetical protein [Microbacterium sp. SLBN-146]|uniref:hypothetical protein n=1 Tax=Microbacterium sp. SLBN-146 TaxID=2768457 RepID=UPI00114F80C7|nr:hypothetical protein [Microbacterium sp. SLBN-146]